MLSNMLTLPEEVMTMTYASIIGKHQLARYCTAQGLRVIVPQNSSRRVDLCKRHTLADHCKTAEAEDGRCSSADLAALRASQRAEDQLLDLHALLEGRIAFPSQNLFPAQHRLVGYIRTILDRSVSHQRIVEFCYCVPSAE